MHKLFRINSVDFPDPEGTVTVNRTDKTNTYQGEDGSKTIEVVRSGIISASVNYKGLMQSKLKTLCSALRTVSVVEMYDPQTDSVKKFNAEISGIKTDKSWYKSGLSVWKLSFNIDEL